MSCTAAFHTVDHNILLNRLRRSFSIDATVLNLFESYVTCRKEAVHLSGTAIYPHQLVCGVSQDSIFGSLLFVLCTADIGSIIAA